MITTFTMSLTRSNLKGVNLLIQPLYAIFNIFILLNAHSSISSHASALADSDTVSEETLSGARRSEINYFMPSIVLEFVDRMKSNGVDHIELMDVLLCGCLVLLGLELLSEITLKLCGCKLKVLYYKIYSFS